VWAHYWALGRLRLPLVFVVLRCLSHANVILVCAHLCSNVTTLTEIGPMVGPDLEQFYSASRTGQTKGTAGTALMARNQGPLT